MKGPHDELITGLLLGVVISGMFGTQLATYLPLLVVILGVTFGLKILGH